MTDTPSMSADSLMQAGIAASQADDTAAAIECFTRACAADPSAGVPQLLLGSEFASIGQMEDAEHALANAVLLAPGLFIARYQLGLLQFSSGRAAVGLLTWAPLLDVADTEPWPHFVRGFAALAQDRFDDAITHYQAGLQRNVDNPALTGDIEKVMRRIRSIEPAQALSDSQAHVLLANYEHQGRPH